MNCVIQFFAKGQQDPYIEVTGLHHVPKVGELKRRVNSSHCLVRLTC